MSDITMTPAAMQQYFQQVVAGFGGTIHTDGTGTEISDNPASGDSITYDPGVSTGYDGVQPALTLNTGSEQLTQYGNGAATVTGANGNTLAVDHGELYGLSAGGSQRMDLGAATSSQAWQTAIADGFTDSQGAQDLQGTSSYGISGAPTFQTGVGSGSGGAGPSDVEQEVVLEIIQLLSQLLTEL